MNHINDNPTTSHSANIESTMLHIIDNGIVDSNGIESPLLDNFVDGFVDYKGRPVLRSKSGHWRSAYFIIGIEVAERLAYVGLSSNLITYLTGPLGLSTATAAMNVNIWSGVTSLLPLVGAYIADAFLGRYLTIIIASLLYILTLVLLAFSTLIVSDSLCSPQLQVILFFVPLYLLAFAIGGHRPCVQAFGADQFDTNNAQECQAKSSFFNWWNFGMCIGPTLGILVLNYIQDNISWGLSFGIPATILGFALIIFLIGTVTYRMEEKTKDKSSFVKIGHVFVKATQNWRNKPSTTSGEEDCEILPLQGSQKFRFLNKALDGSNEAVVVCSIGDVEEAKAVLQLVPIWVGLLGYALVCSQTSTLFTKQGETMDRSIGTRFQIPAATLQAFMFISIMMLIPVYDTIFVPLTRAITRKTYGITMLQRMGIGMFIVIVSILIAAIVETKRLNTAREYRLVDDPGAMVPMKIWWLLPQYLLFGAGHVFAVVGTQEFFYDQVPSDLRSMGLALYLSVLACGSFLSSILILIVEKMTGGNGQDGWISDNINQGHIDYFYYLLAVIGTAAFVMYIYVARSYVYRQGRDMILNVPEASAK
uniref:protein NRT1/ PTR FAMILY 5.10-like n=1 Tax=Erigeron canadensis TaxID=72917 RepID=UPI001CB8959D|nr:protein NRT1/ PTR FAMILY 5.10-like [Erigeron canadensis]